MQRYINHFIFSIGLLLAPVTVYSAEAGIVLTFDDTSVDQWYDFFAERNDVKATFFVSYWHTLSSAHIEKLRTLQSKGNEIGCHSYDHTPTHYPPYLSEASNTSLYLANEVLPAIANMQAAGFYPVSFAYPNGRHTPAYDDAIRPYLPYLRATTPNAGQTLSTLNELYHNSSSRYGFLSGDGIDSSYQNELPEITAAMQRAKERGEILTLYAHRILPAGETHDYGIPASKLNAVIDQAKALGLRFYTFQEAYRVGNSSAATG
jgi:peptidoglycan/xylan/chitin deacetylase (PgdA/CDA1 family)